MGSDPPGFFCLLLSVNFRRLSRLQESEMRPGNWIREIWDSQSRAKLPYFATKGQETLAGF